MLSKYIKIREMVSMMKQNNLVVTGSEMAMQLFKAEIAAELGIQLGADTSSRDNGRVGGEVTRRLIELGKQQLR